MIMQATIHPRFQKGEPAFQGEGRFRPGTGGSRGQIPFIRGSLAGKFFRGSGSGFLAELAPPPGRHAVRSISPISGGRSLKIRDRGKSGAHSVYQGCGDDGMAFRGQVRKTVEMPIFRWNVSPDSNLVRGGR